MAITILMEFQRTIRIVDFCNHHKDKRCEVIEKLS